MPPAVQSAFVMVVSTAAPLMLAAPAGAVRLGIESTQFTLGGKPTFLLGFSYYGALGAPEEFARRDLSDLRALGLNWFRVWATWDAYGNDVSAVASTGEVREPYLGRLKWLVAAADRRGMVVDVTLSRGARLPNQASHLMAVETLAATLKPWRNVYLDLANEGDIRDARYVSPEELGELRERVRAVDPERLVTASRDLPEDAKGFLATTGLDFISPHRPRHADSPAETEAKTREYLRRLTEAGHPMPVHYQEPFRRGYAEWEPGVDDFLTDLRGAVRGGAAGWCFHNGGNRRVEDERPRRSFDLREPEGRLMDQLDPVEREVLTKARGEVER